MTKKAEKDRVWKVGVTRAAQLYEREETVIRRWCKTGKLVARQPFNGSSWTIYIPDKEYKELLKIWELTRRPAVQGE